MYRRASNAFTMNNVSLSIYDAEYEVVARLPLLTAIDDGLTLDLEDLLHEHGPLRDTDFLCQDEDMNGDTYA
jgi:hypothetical protein